MATDVDVQYFSHLNGLVLGNNWGELIRLLDKALVTGVDFTQITAASIDAQGDVHITLYAAHNAMLFQVVELSGFAPASLNQKYRIKGVPSTTQLILKPKDSITGTTISVVGNGKLAPLGYDIIFRDTDDVKRVYRAKNPTAQHPFIRVDESLTSPDGTTGVYTPTYAKYAMVGLLEHMEHIDDFENPDVLQLPFDPANPAKNWNIAGTGAGVVRGWSRWYYTRSGNSNSGVSDAYTVRTGGRNFTLVGDRHAFYFLRTLDTTGLNNKQMSCCGLFNSNNENSITKNWLLATTLDAFAASVVAPLSTKSGGSPLMISSIASRFFLCKYDEVSPLSAHNFATPLVPDYISGASNLFSSSSFPALEIPIYDEMAHLRGWVKHAVYVGKAIGSPSQTSLSLQDSSMYVYDGVYSSTNGALAFYLGELE